MIAEAVHLDATCLAFRAKGRTREGLTVQSEAQSVLECSTKLCGEQGETEACNWGARSQSLAWGIEQASIRLLLRTLDFAVSFWNKTSCRSLDNSCCTERCVDRSARSCPKLVAVS